MLSALDVEPKRLVPLVRKWLARLFWPVPAIVLVLLILPRFHSGLATEAAFPVPTYMVMNYPLPRDAYATAVQLLLGADPADGDARIAAAEAARDAGNFPARVVPLVRQGLAHAPASGRGWTLLAEAELARKKPARAARALSLALALGPYDYWIAGRRARDAAELWDALSTDDRKQAENQARLLWEEPSLRRNAIALVQTQGGATLMTRALADEPAEIRALNRALSQNSQRSLAGHRP